MQGSKELESQDLDGMHHCLNLSFHRAYPLEYRALLLRWRFECFKAKGFSLLEFKRFCVGASNHARAKLCVKLKRVFLLALAVYAVDFSAMAVFTCLSYP